MEKDLENLDQTQENTVKNSEIEVNAIQLSGDASIENQENAETKTDLQAFEITSPPDQDAETDEQNLEEDEHSLALEMPDYSEFKNEALLLEAKSLFKNHEPQKIKAHMEAIKSQLFENLDKERDEKKHIFLEEGGVEMDFEYHQPLRDQFKALYQEYRDRRNKYYAQIKEEQEINLERRKQIIERLKDLITKEENLTETFKEFKQIQDDWRNAGAIPSAEYTEVYNSYHFHLDNFYDYIKINKDLRDYDFKKNQDQKEDLIKKVEALAQETDLKVAFAELQQLHKLWKEVGPVARELRDDLWDRFSAATKVLHDKRQEYMDQLRADRDQQIANKIEIVKVLESISVEHINSHQEWQKIMKGVEEAREAFRKIGRVIHPENDVVWEAFTAAARNINKAKNEFYKSIKQEQTNNLKLKKELLDKAIALKDSDDWKMASEEYKRIQHQWKNIGPVPKIDSDKIWKEFREACNYFFDRLQASTKKVDAEFEQNYLAKKALLDKFIAESENEFTLQSLKDLITEWKSMGQVPRDKKSIEIEFNQLLDAKFEKLNLDKKEGALIRFENKMNALLEGGEGFKIAKENDFLRKKLDETQRELAQLETNINFFSSKDGKNPFLKDVERSIKNHQESLELIQAKLKLLRKFPNEIYDERPRQQSRDNNARPPFNKNRQGGGNKPRR